MTNKQKVEKLAKELGCTIICRMTTDYMQVYIDAPDKHSFNGDLHSFTGYAYKGCNETDAMWKDFFERMSCERPIKCEANCDCLTE